MRTFSLPPVTIVVAEGDITARDVEAIVNAANNALWMGSGVAGAIKTRGGEAIEREAMAQGPIEPGEAVITSAGRLTAKYVIHAAAMGQDLRTDATLIRSATRSALDLAARQRLSSIAFPALGTGVGGFPAGDCAGQMIAALRDHVTAGTSVRRVEFVLFGHDTYLAFSDAVAAVLPADH